VEAAAVQRHPRRGGRGATFKRGATRRRCAATDSADGAEETAERKLLVMAV